MKNIKAIFGCLTVLAMISTSCTVTTSRSANTGSPTPATKATTSGSPTAAKTLPASKIVPAPADWITMSDDRKGYSFEVPKGTEHSIEQSNGIDVFIAATPDPMAVGVMVMAFKDPSLSKTDLVKVATGGLEGLGAKNIKIGELTELSADYSLGSYTALNSEGKPVRGKMLVATDVTDNYVMIVGSEENEFKANEKVIDEIWGSFSMQSGGSSGKN
jgi:hypothetical protein